MLVIPMARCSKRRIMFERMAVMEVMCQKVQRERCAQHDEDDDRRSMESRVTHGGGRILRSVCELNCRGGVVDGSWRRTGARSSPRVRRKVASSM